MSEWCECGDRRVLHLRGRSACCRDGCPCMVYVPNAESMIVPPGSVVLSPAQVEQVRGMKATETATAQTASGDLRTVARARADALGWVLALLDAKGKR